MKTRREQEDIRLVGLGDVHKACSDRLASVVSREFHLVWVAKWES